MKTVNIIRIAIVTLVIVAMQSCLKDVKAPITDSEATHNVIEFGDTGPIESPSGSVYALYTPVMDDFVNDTAGFYINVSYSGADNAPEDITVKLGVDNDAIAKYNADQDKSYQLLPSGTYSFPDSLVIKKGYNGAVHLRGIIKKTSDLKTDVDYALPLKIVSASSGIISGNFGTVLYSFTF